jgi:hypothetical protein
LTLSGWIKAQAPQVMAMVRLLMRAMVLLAML